MSRRTLVLASLAASAGWSLRAQELPVIRVSKDAACPCCESWVDYLRAEGFQVEVSVLDLDALEALKSEVGLPAEAWSCHTGRVDGYILEGHVPAADIRRLLTERPDAIGLAVPGMPFGSPGMGPESEREAYAVLLVGRDGSTSQFSAYPAAT